jgi:hypothetical protein
MAAHQTQFSFEPNMLPAEMLRDLFGLEYFVRVKPEPELERDLWPNSAQV